MAGTVLGVFSVAGGFVGTEREGDGGVERRLMSSVIHSRSQSISKISVTHYFLSHESRDVCVDYY